MPLKVKQKFLENDDDAYMEIADEMEDLSDEFEKDILHCYWKTLDADYEYFTSEEAIIETIISNDYEFEEDGSIF